MWVHRFKVQRLRDLPFPIDMLRFDACHPVSQQDISNLTHGFAHLVELEHRCADKEWEPTDRRWASFGWQVV